jgi:hypothetical protein
MSQIPADLDQTMWEIAERSDQKAAGDFSEKFPDLAASMAARMQMVNGMKDMRGALALSFVPPFKPKFMYKPKPLWVRYGPMVLGLAALAGASFYITQNMLTPLPTSDALNPRASVVPKTLQAPPVELPRDPGTPNMESPQPFGKEVSEDVPTKHVTMSNVKLQDAITAIAKQGNLTVEPLAADFPNPLVKVDLTGKPGLEILQQLGQKEGFKVIEDGNGQVIILPGADDVTPAAAPTTADSSKPPAAGSSK